MAIDFPNSPTTGDTYTAGGRTWQWDGTVWAAYGNYPDPTVLKIDTGTNRVGINNTSPTTALDVTGDLTVSGKVNATAPTSTKTASYTLAAGDENTRIVMNNAGATTITVDDGVFAAGDTVWIHNIGAGTTTVTAGTATVDTAGSLDVGQWEGGSLYFTSASSAIFFRGGGAGVAYGAATGGTSSTITVDGDSYTLLEFTSSSTLTVTKAGVFDVLVVGGGGGGGTAGSLICGAGAAGGYRQFDKVYFDTNQTVVVGAGDSVNGYRGTGSRCGQPFVGGGGSTNQYLQGRNGASVVAVDTPRLSAARATTQAAITAAAVRLVLVAAAAVLGQLVLTLRRAQAATVATDWTHRRFAVSPQELPITQVEAAVKAARPVASAVLAVVETAKTRATHLQQEPPTQVVAVVATAPLVDPALS